MGLFNIIKQVIAFRKAFKEQIQREAEYVQMPNAELSKLSDDELRAFIDEYGLAMNYEDIKYCKR